MKRTCLGFLCSLFFVCNSFSQNTLAYSEIESIYLNGLELFQKQAYPAAREQFKQYLTQSEATHKDNSFTRANASYYHALSALYSNSPDAQIEIERFVINYSDHPKAQLIFSNLANELYDSGDYAASVEYFKRAIENRVENLSTYELRYKLGVSYYMLNQKKEALDEFNLVKNSTSVNADDAAYYAGIINYQNNNYDQALKDLLRVESKAPYNKDVPTIIGQIYYQQKQYDLLLEYAVPIIDNPRGRQIKELCLVCAEVYFFKNNFERAAFYYDKLSQFTNQEISEQVSFRQGYSYYKTNQFSKSLPIFKRIAAKDNPLGQQAAYYLGISALKSDDKNSALAAFDAARRVKYDPQITEESAFDKIKLLIDLGITDQAIKDLKQYVQDYPSGRYINEANEYLSEILSESSNYQEAIRYIESVRNKTPKIKAAYQKLTYNQGVMAFNTNHFQDAIYAFDKSIGTATDQNLATAASFWKAEASSALGLPGTEQLYKALSNSSSQKAQIKSAYSLGYLYFNKKEYKAAKAQFQKFYNASSNDPSYSQNRADALLRIADCQLIDRDFKGALENYNLAYQQGEANQDYALYQKGLTLGFMGRESEAKTTFAQLERQFPSSRLIDQAVLENANISLGNANYREALPLLNSIVSTRPNSELMPEILLKRALCNNNLKNYDAAIADYKKVINQFGDSPEAEEALLGLRETLSSTNRLDEFSSQAEVFKQNNPGSNSIVTIEFEAAKTLYFSEKYNQAIPSLKSFIQQYPNSSQVDEANFLIAESYFILNKPNDALPYYSKAVASKNPKFLSKAAYRSANILLDQKKYDQAITDFKMVESISSNQREIVNAWIGIMLASYHSKDYNQVKTYAEKIKKDGGGIIIGAENQASLYIGKANLEQKNYSEAKAAFEQTMAMSSDENAAEANYSIGLMQYQQKNYDQSIETLQKLAQNYSEFLEWYEKAFLLISDDYHAKGDKFMAEATLKSIIENSDNPETVKIAKSKLSQL